MDPNLSQNTTSSPEDSPKSSSKILKLLVGIILVVIILGVVGDYLFFVKGTRSTPDSTPTPSPADPTANWNTYNSTDYRFTMKVPPQYISIYRENTFEGDYDVLFASSQAEKEQVEECFAKRLPECNGYSLGIMIEELANTEQLPLEELLTSRDISIDSLTPTIISGRTALQGEREGIGKVHEVFVDRGYTVLHIFANTNTNAEENMELYKKALTTLRFFPE